MAKKLDAQAREFADQTSELLNKTVTDGIRISAVETLDGERIMGCGVSRTQARPDPIAIAYSRRKAVVYLYLAHLYDIDDEKEYLTMASSIMSLYTSPDMGDEQLIVSVDYTRDPANKYPGAHLHVGGVRDDLDSVYLGDDRKTRKLRDLHLPVGGKRFRPALEDLIEFMVTEEMVDPRPNWRVTLDLHRAKRETLQLKAAVRRNQEAAAEALKASGWEVSRGRTRKPRRGA